MSHGPGPRSRSNKEAMKSHMSGMPKMPKMPIESGGSVTIKHEEGYAPAGTNINTRKLLKKSGYGKEY